jgi:hypothetical protein
MQKLKLEQEHRQHWHGGSERYTGGDGLLTALQEGWTIQHVSSQEYPLSRGRYVIVYHLKLQRATVITKMNVIANPIVMLLMAQYTAKALPVVVG